MCVHICLCVYTYVCASVPLLWFLFILCTNTSALVTSLIHREEYNLLNAAFQIIQGGVIPMDITTVETADKKTLYMTILAGWGLISDIDIESESLRKIGETRFILGIYSTFVSCA